jgi:hypothetical protein
MNRLKYDYNMLKSICDEGVVTLLEDYKDKYITRDTRIIGKCILCENSFDKSLNKLHKQRNFGCLACAKKFKFDKIKNTMVEKYGVEYAVQSEDFFKKMKTSTMEKYGVEYACQSEEIKGKIKQTNLEKYGTEYGLQNEVVKEKKRQTNLKKYGFDNPLQCQEIKEKCRKTCLQKYGTEFYSQTDEFKEKFKESNLKKYGVEYGFQSEVVKDKIKHTNLEKYGFENPLQCPEIKEKSKKTNLEKYGTEFYSQTDGYREKYKITSLINYGTEHPSQNSEFMEKLNRCMYKSKEYCFPSGNIVKIQGYEHFALNELIINLEENEIILGCKHVPEIWYTDANNKQHKHYVDIYIPSQNKCIEIKSEWTFIKQKNTIFQKQTAAKNLGYLYEIWIYDYKGNKIKIYD